MAKPLPYGGPNLEKLKEFIAIVNQKELSKIVMEYGIHPLKRSDYLEDLQSVSIDTLRDLVYTGEKIGVPLLSIAQHANGEQRTDFHFIDPFTPLKSSPSTFGSSLLMDVHKEGLMMFDRKTVSVTIEEIPSGNVFHIAEKNYVHDDALQALPDWLSPSAKSNLLKELSYIFPKKNTVSLYFNKQAKTEGYDIGNVINSFYGKHKIPSFTLHHSTLNNLFPNFTDAVYEKMTLKEDMDGKIQERPARELMLDYLCDEFDINLDKERSVRPYDGNALFGYVVLGNTFIAQRAHNKKSEKGEEGKILMYENHTLTANPSLESFKSDLEYALAVSPFWFALNTPAKRYAHTFSDTNRILKNYGLLAGRYTEKEAVSAFANIEKAVGTIPPAEQLKLSMYVAYALSDKLPALAREHESAELTHNAILQLFR